MGWFDSVLSVATTVGNVAGALQGGANRAVHFGPMGVINPNLGGLVFFNDPTLPSQVSVLNQNSDGSTVAIFFPSNSLVGNSPTEITLPFSTKIGLGPAFSNAASGGIDEFRINLNPQIAAGALSDDTGNININSSSTAVLNPGATIQVGSYFTATLNQQTITIGAVSAVTLVGVVLLNVRGATGNLVRIIRALKSTGSDITGTNSIELAIPNGIDVAQGITYTELTCVVTESSLLSVANNEGVKKLTESDFELLRNLQSAR